jgi:hypothetical protein
VKELNVLSKLQRSGVLEIVRLSLALSPIYLEVQQPATESFVREDEL